MIDDPLSFTGSSLTIEKDHVDSLW